MKMVDLFILICCHLFISLPLCVSLISLAIPISTHLGIPHSQSGSLPLKQVTGTLRKQLLCAHINSFCSSRIQSPKCLSRALRDENPKLLMVASALILPIQPLKVSAVHTGTMEVAFAKRALKDSKTQDGIQCT